MLCMASLLLTGCSFLEETKEPQINPNAVATLNPNITVPQGQFYTAGDTLYAEGGLSAWGDGFIKLMIEGKEIEFALSPTAQKHFDTYVKNGKLARGTMLSLDYTKKNLIFVANSISLLQANSPMK